MASLAVVGGYGTGITVCIDRLPGAGETLVGHDASVSHGGKGSNQAVAARRLGAEVALLTAIGTDDRGTEATRMWTAEGVRATAPAKRLPTMMGIILVEPDGENRIVVALGALTELGSKDVEAFAPHIRVADLCVISLEIPLEAVAATLRLAADAGVPTLLNPAPASEMPEEILADVAYLTPNLMEAQTLTGLTAKDPAPLLDALCRKCQAAVVITLGAGGAAWGRGDERGFVAAVPPGVVVDTTGAGDAFTAAFAVGIANGCTLSEAVEFGAAAGAYAVRCAGVLPGLPTSRELAAFSARPPRLPEFRRSSHAATV